jgi:hypothetical protein
MANLSLEEDLDKLPDIVATKLLDWRKATLLREKEEALLYMEFKASGKEKRTVNEIEALVHSSDRRFNAVLKEATAESDYIRHHERLLAKKKLADLRTAF